MLLEIEEKLNNWFLLNKEKKVRFITQSYIPVDRTPVDKDEKYEETRAFHLYTVFFSSSTTCLLFSFKRFISKSF